MGPDVDAAVDAGPRPWMVELTDAAKDAVVPARERTNWLEGGWKGAPLWDGARVAIRFGV